MESNDKNETTRFLGDGVSFKAKLIGILEVSEARGDRMCQEALSDLKMAIRAAGEHKQRITINIAIDGLRLRDEKTGDSLYHHPVHKISFIAQDMTDSRAFGYIFGSPDTGHRFFGIKTDKAASQVVIAMRDLFQVVFALKKKEIELAKQHLDKSRFTSSPLFSDNALPKLPTLHQDMAKSSNSDSKASGGASSESKSGGGGGGTTAVADLVDLELELNSLQQGLTQMERITPSDPFGSKDDPFGDSFTSYTKPILPPPPSSGRERISRTSESGSLFSPRTPHTVTSGGGSVDTTSSLETSLLGSGSKDTTKITRTEFTFSQDFNSSREEPSSGDWFTPSAGNSIFEEQPSSLVNSEPSKDEKHELAKQEILSQFDVFTELDPLGTGRSKPYIDKKHFFQELKNPPKKVLNDLVCQNQPSGAGPTTTTATNAATTDQKLFNATFNNNNNNNNNNRMAVVTVPVATSVNPSTISAITSTIAAATNDFTADPFGEDPFVTEDPFAETDFSKQDPFEAEFGDFKVTHSSKVAALNNLDKKFKIDTSKSDSLQSSSLYQNNLCRSPVNSTAAITIMSTSPKTTSSTAVHYDSTSKFSKLAQLHENASLDMSSESSECAPEPPPRPASTLVQIKPPPLPPKKQANDMSIRPPPRPPHSMTEDPHYDYMDNYETAPNSLEFIRQSASSAEKSPPLPVPVRKAKFDHQDVSVPERPRKQQFGTQAAQSSEEDYLTPISFPEQKSETSAKRTAGLSGSSGTSGILLPPPQKSGKKSTATGPAPTSTASTGSLDGLDITLSQLTLSGLNELAAKLNIPASQLSNMTLVQLTSYLSNFIKSKSEGASPSNVSSKSSAATGATTQDAIAGEFPVFKADFAANFSSFNSTGATASGGTTDTSYDRYAVFRELIKEEIKQTKIDTEPEELQEEKQQKLNGNLESSSTSTGKRDSESEVTEDKYAALREIVEKELKSSETEQQPDTSNESIVGDNEAADLVAPDRNDLINEESTEDTTTKIINLENRLLCEDKTPDKKMPSKYSSLIEQYSTSLLNSKDSKVILSAAKSPPKSPRSPVGRAVPIKSPVPAAVTEIILQSTRGGGGGGRLNSGSLSDVISGSSPEIDNTASNSEAGKKTGDATGETWAIFEQGGGGAGERRRVPSVESAKEKQTVQSEEGVSPWSSDSKEFGNGSPPADWRRGGGGGRGGDSGSGGDHRHPRGWPTNNSNAKRRGRKQQQQQQDHHQEGWWDTSAEPEMQYYPSSNQHRRSTDSYEEEYYECYEQQQQQQQQQRPTRRRKQSGYAHGQSIGAHQTSAAAASASASIGHSSSSRDVSPWEEEPAPLPPQRGNVGRREMPLASSAAAMREREREPKKAGGGGRSTGAGQRHHGRQHSFEKSRDRDGTAGRRHKTAPSAADSWDDDDDDDDYEYEDEHIPRYHHRPPDRYRDGSERESSSRHGAGSRDHDSDRWTDDWTDDSRRYTRRRRDGAGDRDNSRWCCPDWEQEKLSRYGGSGRYSEPIPTSGGGGGSSWRDRKQQQQQQQHEDDRYYGRRESQESPWEDEDDYSNGADDIPPPPPLHANVMPPPPLPSGGASHYLTTAAVNKRNWKQRPSSASEMDRKTGEIRSSSRHHLGTGGSDGERDRRYKPGRRSRSRDSQYSEPPMGMTSSTTPGAGHRHKAPPASESAVGITPSGGSARSSFAHRPSAAATGGKQFHGLLPSNKAQQQFEMEFEELTASARTSTAEIAIVKTSLSLSEHGADDDDVGIGVGGSLKSKSATLASRKKSKDQSPKSEENVVIGSSTFPRNKGAGATSRAALNNKSLFENDFVVNAATATTTGASEESPVVGRVGGAKFNFDNDFETSETESPPMPLKSGGLKTTLRQHQSLMFEKSHSSSMDCDHASTKDQQSTGPTYTRQRSLRESRLSSSSPRFQQSKPKSLFEDDFSPSGEKPDPLPEDNSISSIKEEIDPNEEDEEDDSFHPASNNFEQLHHQHVQAPINDSRINKTNNNHKKKFNKHRLSSSANHHLDGSHIKKSESVNIFARENDPFDDDFFSESALDRCRGMLQDDEDYEEEGEDDEDQGSSNASRRRNNKTRTTDLKWTDDFEEYGGTGNRRK